MVEQAYTCEYTKHTKFITGCDYIAIANRTAGLCDVLCAAFVCPLYIVAKNASEPTETSSICDRKSEISCAVRTGGLAVK